MFQQLKLGLVRCSIFQAKSLAQFDQPRADPEPNRAARDRLPSLPKRRYHDECIAPDVQRFVAEHAEIFRRFMHDAWVGGLTISGLKSAIGMPGVKIVGMVCNYDGRSPEERKVLKILDWPSPRTL